MLLFNVILLDFNAPVPTFHSSFFLKFRQKKFFGCAFMGEGRGVYRVLLGRPEGKRPLGRPTRRGEDNIKIDLREIEIDEANWIRLAQDRVQWRAFVNTLMNLRVP
jgi:hypothetical protein